MKKKIEVLCVIISFVFAGNAFAANFKWVGQWAEHRYHADSGFTRHYMLFDVVTDDPTDSVYVQGVPGAGDLQMNRSPGWDNPGNGSYSYGLDLDVEYPDTPPPDWPDWEGTYTYYIDLDESGDLSDGDPTASSTVPAGYYNPYTPMVLAQNVNISGTYTPTVYWEQASGADTHRVRLFPIVDGEPSTDSVLYDSGNIFYDGPYYHGGETPYFEYTLPSGYFDSDQTLAICIEARVYADGLVKRSRYLVKHSAATSQTSCDVNGDGKTGLAEAIHALQVSSGLKPVPVSAAPAPVEKTGQTTSYETGDDGDLQTGVAWPNPRFTDNGDGTVKDNLTGLIWLKNANWFGRKNWATALTECNALASGIAGLTDGSIAGDWRLPSLFELESLRDMAYYNPAISNTTGTAQWTEGNPFTGVQSDYYWSGTTFALDTELAWHVSMSIGFVGIYNRADDLYVWPVRGDN